MKHSVTVGYDSGGIFYVYSSDVPGLDAEAKSFDTLIGIVRETAPRLLSDPAPKLAIQPGVVLCKRTTRP
jgi:hypothetical protein